MDPFTAAATVLTVVGMVLKASKETHEMVEGIRTAPAQIQRLATELRDLYSLLGTFQALLDRQSEEPSDTVREMLDNLQSLLQNCLTVLKDVKAALGPLIRPDGTAAAGLWRGFQYAAFRRSDIIVLQQTLGSYKAMLNMSYSALNVMYASNTHNVVKRIDENTTKVDERLEDIQLAVRRLEKQIDRKEQEEQEREVTLQKEGLVKAVPVETRTNARSSKRLSIAKYSSQLRESIKSFESIISSTSPSRAVSINAHNHEEEPPPYDFTAMDDNKEGSDLENDDPKSIRREDSIRVEINLRGGVIIPKNQTSRLSLLDDVDFIMGKTLNLNALRLSDTDVWGRSRPGTLVVSDTVYSQIPKLEPGTEPEEATQGFENFGTGDFSPDEVGVGMTIAAPKEESLIVEPSNPDVSAMEPVTPLFALDRFIDDSSQDGLITSYRLTSGTQVAEELLEDLKYKVVDWKGHQLDNFGKLILYDVVKIGKTHANGTDSARPFHSYLFEKILICCKPISLRSAEREYGWTPRCSVDRGRGADQYAYKLKGRIHMQDITSIKQPGMNVELMWSGDGSNETVGLQFEYPSVRTEWTLWLGIQAQKLNTRPNHRRLASG